MLSLFFLLRTEFDGSCTYFFLIAELCVHVGGLSYGEVGSLPTHYIIFFYFNFNCLTFELNQKISLPHELKVPVWLWLSFDFDFSLTLTWGGPHIWLPHHPWSSAWLSCQKLTYFDFGKFLKIFPIIHFLNFFFTFATVTGKIAFWGTLSHFLTPKVGSRRMLGLWGWILTGHTPQASPNATYLCLYTKNN